MSAALNLSINTPLCHRFSLTARLCCSIIYYGKTNAHARKRNALLPRVPQKEREKMKQTTLNNLKIGQEAVITAVGGDGPLRCHLLDMGIIPKTKVVIRKVAPMGDPIEIHLRGYELSIRLEDAKQITVEVDG